MYNSQPEERLEGWYPHILVIYHISWGMPEFQPCDWWVNNLFGFCEAKTLLKLKFTVTVFRQGLL